MKKILKLKVCDWTLLVFTALILASGIQLEATGSSSVAWVWVHIVVGTFFMALSLWHVYLHFGASNWFSRFHKLKSPVTRILWWITLLTLVTAVITAVHWLTSFTHSSIGGVHGKLGFLMIFLCICHIVKRVKFFRTAPKRK